MAPVPRHCQGLGKPTGFGMGISRVRVRVDILLPNQNPYPVEGIMGISVHMTRPCDTAAAAKLTHQPLALLPCTPPPLHCPLHCPDLLRSTLICLLIVNFRISPAFFICLLLLSYSRTPLCPFLFPSFCLATGHSTIPTLCPLLHLWIQYIHRLFMDIKHSFLMLPCGSVTSDVVV